MYFGDNMKMYLGVIRWGCVDCIDLAQVKYQWRVLVNTVVKLQVPFLGGYICILNWICIVLLLHSLKFFRLWDSFMGDCHFLG
jgi:hypothetical protein